MNIFSNLILSHRFTVGSILLAALVVSVWGTTQVGFDDDPRAGFARPGPAMDCLDQLFEDFGPDDNDLLLVIDGDDLFDPESISRIRTLVEDLEGLDGVESVFSIFDARRQGSRTQPLFPATNDTTESLNLAREQALRHPIIAGQLLSKDAKTMAVVLRLAGDSLTVQTLKKRLTSIRHVVNDSFATTSLRVRMAGHPAIRVDMIDTVRGDISKFLMISGLVAALLGLVLFQHPVPVLVATAGPALGVLWIVGSMGLIGENINGLNSVLPSIVFIIGFTDSVHLLLEIRRRRSAGEPRLIAVRGAIREVGPACALTSLTTAVGFGSLMIAELEVLQRFGAACACGTMCCFVAVITVVPILASTKLGDLIVTGTGLKRMKRSQHTTELSTEQSPPGRPENESFSSAYLQMFRRPGIVAGISVAFTIGLCLMATRLRSDIRWTEMLPYASETVQVTEHFNETFGGSLLAYVVVQWPDDKTLSDPEVLGTIIEVHRLIDRQVTMRGAFSPINLVRSFAKTKGIRASDLRQLNFVPPRIRNRVLRRDLNRAVVTAHVPDIGAAQLLPKFSQFDKDLAEIESRHPGFHLQLTGTLVVSSRNVHRMIGDLGKSLALAICIVFVMMTITFRSIRIGLISIVPNVFPLAFTAGLLVATNEHLRLTSAMVFCVSLGIAVDDTVHFLTRFRRQQLSGTETRQAIQKALSTVGSAMIVTSAILIGGFAALTFSQMPPVALFGKLTIIAVAAALVADLVMLPALLLCFGNQHDSSSASRDDQVDMIASTDLENQSAASI